MAARKVRGMVDCVAGRAVHAANAYELLQRALFHARAAGAAQLIPRVRWALKSAEGARRHAALRRYAGR